MIMIVLPWRGRFFQSSPPIQLGREDRGCPLFSSSSTLRVSLGGEWSEAGWREVLFLIFPGRVPLARWGLGGAADGRGGSWCGGGGLRGWEGGGGGLVGGGGGRGVGGGGGGGWREGGGGGKEFFFFLCFIFFFFFPLGSCQQHARDASRCFMPRGQANSTKRVELISEIRKFQHVIAIAESDSEHSML